MSKKNLKTRDQLIDVSGHFQEDEIILDTLA